MLAGIVGECSRQLFPARRFPGMGWPTWRALRPRGQIIVPATN